MDKQFIPERTTSLRHFLTVVFKRLWVIVAVVVLTLLLGAYQVFRLPPQYEASAKLLLERDPELEKALLLRVSASSQSDDASYTYTKESEIMTSRPVLERVINTLRLVDFSDTLLYKVPRDREKAMQDAVRGMSKSLIITPTTDPSIIKVAYQDGNPLLAASVVNTLVDRYMEYRFEIFNDDQTIAFLNRQIEEAAAKLNDLQQKKATFQSDGTLYTPDKEGDLLFTKLSDYENRAEAIHLERITLESKLNALRVMVRSGNLQELPALDLGPSGAQMQNVIELKSQMRTLEYERDLLRQKYTDSYVEIQEKTEAIEALRKRINGEIAEIITVLEAALRSLTEEENTLRKTAGSIRQDIRGLSSKELEMARLSRGINEGQELYSLLLKQREEARLSQSKKEMVVRVKVLSAATVPLKPVPSNRGVKMGMVLFLGLFAGISLAFFTDFFDHSLKNAEDVQRYMNLDVLASIRSFERS
ncbi:MAG: hypothetical protein C4524_05820 [Candidatus Zixiibacteriota bacterium]|nr:MAG: hypothetical protein C4524_05820 [candidate division Zixibacteria bacterium]